MKPGAPRWRPARGTRVARAKDAEMERPSWLRRVGWLVLIYAAGVVTVGIVAVLIRMLMSAAGMTVPH
ncbi:DUF2474 domain-containing protein [Hyphomicrobium facile]|uniref:DUF2474 domain-containing protein n=1 Tax=Hyphomicrobium facile TaxID=51670 RepID=A0A1I7NUC2_9HYPH|nr:DUF2474 domain-containing protein [Hyphomicrobium facile]SFV38222.1 Protein of unknown function [Hyphomicrobium facile]